MNSLYNTFSNMCNNTPRLNNSPTALMAQVRQLQQNPSAILDILANSGKINLQLYQELQQYKNNPQAIFQYLYNHGNANELSLVLKQVSNLRM